MQCASSVTLPSFFKLLIYKDILGLKNWHAACDNSCGTAVGVIPQ